MRIILLAVFIAASAFAQTPRYPTAVATTTDLTNVEDRAQSTLAAGLNTTATSFIVVSAAKFTAHMILTIDNEQIKICAIAGSTISVGHSACPSLDGRGFAGTSAASHVSGSLVSDYVVAYQHKALREEIKAIEGTLGANMSGVQALINSSISTALPPPANLPQVLAVDYDFAPQTPGGSMSAGANAITMTPVPVGVNGTDSNHYLRISGGAGAAESCLITGGTGVAGNASGQIILTCSNTHAGAWTVASATGGLQEAIQAVTPGKNIVISTATTVYATVTVKSPVVISCSAGSTVTWAGGATTMIAIAANEVTVRDCRIVGGSAHNVITNSGSPVGLLFHNNYITGGYDVLNFTGGSRIDFTSNRISGFTHTGIGTQFNVTTTYARAIGNYVDSSGCTIRFCGAISFWGSNSMAVGNHVIIGGNEDGGVFIGNSTTSGIVSGIINDNDITVVGGFVYECSNMGNVRDFSYSNNTCRVAGSITHPGFIGFEIGGSSNGSMHGNSYDGGDIGAVQSGMLVQSTSNVSIVGNTFRGLGNATDSHAISMLHTNGDSLTSLSMLGNTVSNNVIHAPLTRGSKILIDTTCDPGNPSYTACLAASIKNTVIQGNTITGSNITGEQCIRVSNNSSLPAIQYSGTRVSSNTLDTCYIGIGTYDSFNNVVDNNRIVNTTTTRMYDDLSAGLQPNARVSDVINGIPFADLSGQYGVGHLNGSMIYCTDCTVATPCAGSGTGALAKRLNNLWSCN